MAEVELSQVNKIYPNGFQAVYDAEFTVADREFVVLVGPSGCGKTTLLRMVAGLEEVTSGDLSIGGRRVNDVAPRDRDVAMVFQNYALYPHMSVFDNMAMGLRIRKLPKEEIRREVGQAATLLGIEHLLDRRPSQLSGGQRQRVALGRAIVRRPQAFLFDEPLSNLDAKMRVETRTEISRLHHRLEATMIYVTHDQTEAMTMGDRIVVMDQGRVQQVATPLGLYNQPANRFVAGFVGSPAMNFWPVELVREDGLGLRRKEDSSRIEGEIPDSLAKLSDRRLVVGLRPEDFHLDFDSSAFPLYAIFHIEIEVVEPLGSETMIYWREEEVLRVARVQASQAVGVGDEVDLLVDLSHAHFFEPESGDTLLSWPGAVNPPR